MRVDREAKSWLAMKCVPCLWWASETGRERQWGTLLASGGSFLCYFLLTNQNPARSVHRTEHLFALVLWHLRQMAWNDFSLSFFNHSFKWTTVSNHLIPAQSTVDAKQTINDGLKTVKQGLFSLFAFRPSANNNPSATLNFKTEGRKQSFLPCWWKLCQLDRQEKPISVHWHFSVQYTPNLGCTH